MTEPKLTRNRAQCPLCLDVIESKYRHDFVSCKCGEIHVDGGLDDNKRGWNTVQPIEMSEYK